MLRPTSQSVQYAHDALAAHCTAGLPRWVAVWVTAAVLAIVAASLVAPVAPAAAVGQHVVIAQQRNVTLGGGEWLARLADVPLAAGAAPVTHTHTQGFTLAVTGPHDLILSSRRVMLAPGQAAWVGEQEDHTHAPGSDAAGRFYFIGMFPSANRGTVPSGIAPSEPRLRETETFSVAAGPYDMVLSEVRLPAAGDAVTLSAQNGPAGLWLGEGQASLSGQALRADGATLVRPGTATTLTSAAGGARVIMLAALPAGAASTPGLLPRTGSPHAAAAPPVLAAAAASLAAAGSVVALWLARMGRRVKSR